MSLLSTWRGRFIAAFVTVQVLLPLRYYLGTRDPHDERFAWRMFSPMRMTRCAPAFVRDGKPVNLGAEFHEAWIELATRGRLSVIENMADELCERHAGSSLRFTMSCSYMDGSHGTFGDDANLCRRGK